MAFALDLAAYVERIGYAGPLRPDLETLNGIVAAHVRTIPFENLDVLLSRPISLDLEHIARKLIDAGRGGYCFEQNTFLFHVLEVLGFRVKALSARVRVQRVRDSTPPRTHVFLRVELGGESWLADVGLGGLSPTSALRLVPDITQTTPHEPRRIVCDGAWSGFEQRAPDARLFHQAYFAGAWHDVCEFTLEEMPPIDRELANWFTSAHPQSHFKSRLMVARATAEGRITLVNRELSVRHPDGRADTHMVESPAELLAVLAERFALHFPPETHFECPALNW